MQTSSEDEGDTGNPLLTKTFFILLFILPVAVYKPSPKIKSLSTAVVNRHENIITNKPVVAKAKSKKKKLYITFDDGPNKGTKNVLHIVQDEAVPVSFFIVGEHVFASPPQSRLWDSLKMAAQIDLCNHSYSHAHSRYESYYGQPDSVVKDFKRTYDSLDLDNAIARTPGRNIWRIDTLQFTDLKHNRSGLIATCRF